ncbi:DUF3429 domain-containing protein [Sphingomonas qomolangmaensis]|uniref:DUF3429 domain-containing protein n=1 Tax=Sphingomonas qomolangmaensis TaxID=2918765 RepID=A0ABY5L7L5_9SPHN|nr:DUF3429 domain-containing protein [Sphingomonas qomolangmaensis]UUL82146.1 DUF3429 domain-containing protein [Sphingomonas qomolangmaensis]
MQPSAPRFAAIPANARLLGFAGLLPQVAALGAILSGEPEWAFSAQALAFAYAAIIFSFLGGLWWGLAAASPVARAWVFGVSVLPSLVALASAIPWAVGMTWPAPSLMLLGLGIIASLAVDRRLVAEGVAPPWWMTLRVPLSLGLGGLTLAIGVLS